MTEIHERTGADDPYYDFCLWPYTPPTSGIGKLRSISLLFHSFKIAGADGRFPELVHRIRSGLGAFQTVWGIKQAGDRLFWEFYFYDYERKDRKRSASVLLKVIEPVVPCHITMNENYHYFMFSVDITEKLFDPAHGLDEIHMYIGNPGSSVSSGICYSMKPDRVRLENFYFFFDAEKEREEILAKAACSAHLDWNRVSMDRVLWPELRKCNVIVIANKQENDSVYFSGIDVDQLLFFLRSMNYPAETVSFVSENRANLDHLKYDVGFDYRMAGSEFIILKSGYYGIF